MGLKDVSQKVRTAALNHASHELDKLQEVLDLIERLREMIEKAFGVNSKYSAVTSQLRALHESIEDGVATGEITNDKLDYLTDCIKKLYTSTEKLTPDSVDTVIEELNHCEAELRKDLAKNVIMASPETSKDITKNFLNKWEEAIKNHSIVNNLSDKFENYKLRNNIKTEEDLLSAFERDAKIFKDNKGNYFIDVDGMVVQAEIKIDENRHTDVTFHVPKKEAYYEDTEIQGVILPKRRDDLIEVKNNDNGKNVPADKIQFYIYNACKDKGYDFFIDKDIAKKVIENKVASAMKTNIEKIKDFGIENYDIQRLLAKANTKEGYTSDNGKISALYDNKDKEFKIRDNTSGEMLIFSVTDGNIKINKMANSSKDFSTNDKPVHISEWKRDTEEKNAIIARYNFKEMDVSTMSLLKSPEVLAFMGTFGISPENQIEALTRDFDKKEHWSKVDPAKMKDVKKFQNSIENTIKKDYKYKGYKTQLKTFSSDDGKKEYTFLNIFAKNGDRMSFAFDNAGNPVTMNYYDKENDKKFHSFCDLTTMCIAHETTELSSDKDFCNMYDICRQVLGKDILAEIKYTPVEKLDDKQTIPSIEKFGLVQAAFPVNEKVIFDDNRPTAYVAMQNRQLRSEITQMDKDVADSFNNVALYAINLPNNTPVREMDNAVIKYMQDKLQIDNTFTHKNVIAALHDMGVIPTETNGVDSPKRMTEKEYVQVLNELASTTEMREMFDKYVHSPTTFTEAMKELNTPKENFTAVLLDSYAVSPDRNYSVYTNSVLADYTKKPEIEGLVIGVVERCIANNEPLNTSTIQKYLETDYNTASQIMNTVLQCGIGIDENNSITLTVTDKTGVINQMGINNNKSEYEKILEIAKDYAPALDRLLSEKDEITISDIKATAHVSRMTSAILASNLVKEEILNAPEEKNNTYKVNKDRVNEEHNKINTNDVNTYEVKDIKKTKANKSINERG